jgi:hypothetical protein
MAKFISENGLVKLVSLMKDQISGSLGSVYGSLMSQVGDTYVNNITDDCKDLEYRVLLADTSNGTDVSMSSVYVSDNDIKYNPSNRTLSGVDTLILKGDVLDDVGVKTPKIIFGDYAGMDHDDDSHYACIEEYDEDALLINADQGITLNCNYGSINIVSSETKIKSVLVADDDNGYIHMPNNANFRNLENCDKRPVTTKGLPNSNNSTSALYATINANNSITAFDTASSSEAKTSHTLSDVVCYQLGTSSAIKNPKWILNPISNEKIDINYNQKLILPGPTFSLLYSSGSTSNRLQSISCTFKATIYKNNVEIGTMSNLGSTAVGRDVLNIANNTSTKITLPDLIIDYLEEKLLDFIKTKDSTFDLQNWKDNISVVIKGDLTFTRSVYWGSTIIQGFVFGISTNATVSRDYPYITYQAIKPHYEGANNGMRHYFNGANYLTMVPGKSTDLCTPELNIETTGDNGVTIIGHCYGTSFFETSDENLKNFSDNIDVDFAKLKEIRKSYFTWKDGNTDKLQIGSSAQDIQKVYPELVSEDKNGNLTVDYAKLSIIALSAIDKLDDRLSRIENMLNIE